MTKDSNSHRGRSILVSLCVPLAIALPLLALFAPVLFQDRMFGFRDTAHFYYPLFEWIETQWRVGRAPLWNPHINYGIPVVGDATSSVFYPGKLVFVLPLEFSWAFKFYIVGHYLLAAAGAYYAARRFQCTVEAAMIAAISFSCGGAVLFQYCNVVFLVGAAWLPWGFAAVEALVARRSLRAAVVLGLVLAMMTLGGDPQTAYQLGFCAAGYALAVAWASRSYSEREANARAGFFPTAITQFALLSLAGIVAFVLSAVQVLPASEASALSNRVAYHQPRNIFEAAKTIATEDNGWSLASNGLFKLPEPETHGASIYEFSNAPWHLAEYVWPGCFGSYFPQYRRWSFIIPGEPRMWNQSIYLGLLPLVLAVASLRLRHGPLREQWLSWSLVIAILGSFGVYGVGWIIRQSLRYFGYMDLAEKAPGDPIGGVYWFFVTFLPGFAYFRFPAKLLTFAALPMSLLAALGFDHWRKSGAPRLRIALLILAFASGVAAMFLFICAEDWRKFFAEMAPDAQFGLFDSDGAWRELMQSLLHTMIVASVAAAFLWTNDYVLIRTRLLVALTMIEIVIANANMIATAPTSIWRERPLLAQMLDEDQAAHGPMPLGPMPLRVRGPAEFDYEDHDGWHTSISPTRIAEIAVADRDLLATNFCLSAPVDSVDTLTSLPLADHAYFCKRYAKNDDSFWGNYWIMPRRIQLDYLPVWEEISSPELARRTKFHVYRNREPMPRACIVHSVTRLPELRSLDPHRLSLRGAEVAESEFGGERSPRNFRAECVIETDGEISPPPELIWSTSASEEPCRVTIAESDRIVIETELIAPGILFVQDKYFPGWEASVATGGNSPEIRPILRTNRIFRGVALPAGKHTVEFRYRADKVWLGAALSALGWLGLIGLVTLDLIRRRTFVAISLREM